MSKARINVDKLNDIVTVRQFGAVNTTSLQAALAASDAVFVNAGLYNGPIDITQSNKTLVMEEGVEFRLPNGTVVGGDVTGPAVLQISGDNVTIQGNFKVNGNKANNDSSSFSTSVLTASLNILGDNCQIYGTATVIDAYWRGLVVGNSLVSGGEVQGFYASKINIENSAYYSVMLWSVVDWRVDEIYAKTNAPGGLGLDNQRVQTGTQTSATSVCARGHIGFIHTDKNCGVILEAKTTDVTIDTVLTGNGGKLEDAVNVYVGSWNAYDCSLAAARVAFAMEGCTNCHVDSVTVKNYQNDGSNIPAISFNGIKTCSVGAIVSSGNKANTPSVELLIREADALDLGSVMLRDPTGTCDGFFYDSGYAPQRDIVVNDLVSRGHTTWDVIVEARAPITIRSINSDALNQYPTNTTYKNITDKEYETSAVWTPTYTTTSVGFTGVTYDIASARYIRIGNLVHIYGSLRTNAITIGAASGVVCIGGLPFTSKNYSNAYQAISLGNAVGFGGDRPINARIIPNTKLVELLYRTTSNGDDIALDPSDMGTGAAANLITFGGTYEVE